MALHHCASASTDFGMLDEDLEMLLIISLAAAQVLNNFLKSHGVSGGDFLLGAEFSCMSLGLGMDIVHINSKLNLC